ncbi:MAG: peptidase [Lachnospiraceae bacterium]|nr:peptidase [Lachnospiraceae bacterium]
MDETRNFLESIGQPRGDLYSLPTSEKRFDDGCQYRFEVPGIQSPGVMRTLLEEFDRLGFYIHRVTQTKGIWTLTDAEITQMVELAKEHQVELILAIGPRATTDTSASVKSPEGVRMGYRLRGQDQIVRAIEDVRRAARLGCRTFLVYDEGCLWALNKARAAGLIPADSKFKISAHSGHGNPCSAKLLEEIGADSFNIVRDYQLQHLAAVRAAINIPIDCHTENPESSGGFIRHYEVPEMIRVAAPIYLKTGGSVAKTHSWDSTDADAKKRAKQVMLVKRMIDEYYPEALYSPKGSLNH